MPYLLTAGTITKSAQPLPMYILARLNVNGQGLSLSNEFLKEKVTISDPKIKAIADRKKASGKLLKAAMTFPGGTHDLWMRYWLSANGVNPNTGRLYASVFQETLYHSDDFGRTWQMDTLADGSLINRFVSVPRINP